MDQTNLRKKMIDLLKQRAELVSEWNSLSKRLEEIALENGFDGTEQASIGETMARLNAQINVLDDEYYSIGSQVVGTGFHND